MEDRPLARRSAALAAAVVLCSPPRSPSGRCAALSFVAGPLVAAAVEDMLDEAHEATADPRGSVALLAGGLCLFVLVSGHFEAG